MQTYSKEPWTQIDFFFNGDDKGRYITIIFLTINAHTHVHTYTDSSSTNTGKDSAQTLENLHRHWLDNKYVSASSLFSILNLHW